MNESNFCIMYDIASHKPGWLSKLETVFKLNEQEVGFLVWLDEQEAGINTKVRAMENQMRRDGFDETLLDCETEEEKMAKLNHLIFVIEDTHLEMRQMDRPYLERAILLVIHRYEHWLALRKKIRGKIIHTQNPTSSALLTENEIEQARHADFKSFTEVKRGFINCLWHDDKTPSMGVSKGYGYCFACNAWCDPIKWWMKQNNCGFVAAVKGLNS